MARGWRWALGALALLGIMAVLVGSDLALTWYRHRGAMVALRDSVPETTAFMIRRASEGKPPRSHRWMPLDSVPSALACAVLAAENVRFFSHGALDWANQRELLSRVIRGDLSRGSSGIAQQLARNLFLAPDRTPRRKLREYLLAYQLSHALSKERQLELYLNVVEWADGVWGVAAASEHLFGRQPGQLTPSQAVLLVNALPAPSRGLAFPLSPSRRSKLLLVTTLLWREAVLDDLAWTATMARLNRMGQFVDAGMTPQAAAEAVTREMGTEALLEAEPPDPPLPLRERCSPWRRGVT
jgi:monofunctional biosynthetic peptidoglycan transglycosylase